MNTYLSTGSLVLLKRLLFLFMIFTATVFVNKEADTVPWRGQCPCVFICTLKLNLCVCVLNLVPTYSWDCKYTLQNSWWLTVSIPSFVIPVRLQRLIVCADLKYYSLPVTAFRTYVQGQVWKSEYFQCKRICMSLLSFLEPQRMLVEQPEKQFLCQVTLPFGRPVKRQTSEKDLWIWEQ